MPELNLPACPICSSEDSLFRQSIERRIGKTVWYGCDECGSRLLWDGEDRWVYKNVGREDKAYLRGQMTTVAELRRIAGKSSIEEETRIEGKQEEQATKRCPRCSGTIQMAAIVCKHCHEPLPGYEDKVPPPLSTERSPIETRQKKGVAMPVLLGLLALVTVVLAFAVCAGTMLFMGRPNATPLARVIPTWTATIVPTPDQTMIDIQWPADTHMSTETDTPWPTDTPGPTATNTAWPTETPEPPATNTAWPTETPEPTATNTQQPTDTPKPTEPPATPTALAGGRLVFKTERDGNSELYIMNPDGSGQRNLTNHPANDFAPQCLPRIARVAFLSDREGEWVFYMMNTDGNDLERLADYPGGTAHASFSPSGKRIAFVSDRSGQPELHVMSADGSGVTQLTNDGARVEEPKWSPDGTRIAFASWRDGGLFAEIYVISPEGSGLSAVTHDGGAGDNDSLSWSPDSTRIVFTSSRLNGYDAWVATADGTGLTRLNSKGGFSPVWSPNGRYIASYDGYIISVMNADGSGEREISSVQAGDNWFAWSPDSTHLAYVSSKSVHGNYEIYLAKADGSAEWRLTRSPGSDFLPCWMP